MFRRHNSPVEKKSNNIFKLESPKTIKRYYCNSHDFCITIILNLYTGGKHLITPDEKESLLNLPIDQKVEKSKSVIREAIEKFGIGKIAVAITGGKDSTTNLWLFRQACLEMGITLPVCMFIDEGDVFDEIKEFVDHIQKLWSLEIAYLKNEDVSSKATGIGSVIKVSSLKESNQAALKEMGPADPEFAFVPDSP